MEYKKEIIGNNIQNERHKLNLTQAELGNLIHTSGKQISIYENPKNKMIPPIDSLLSLCDVFNCELGYLLGESEYSDGTKLRTDIINETGLDSDSLEAIRTITGKVKKDIDCYYEAESYKRILNSLVSSPEFIVFIHKLHELDNSVSKSKAPFQKLENEIGTERLNEALDIINCPTFIPEGSTSSQYSHEQNEDIGMTNSAIDEQIEISTYDIRIARYELYRSFEHLIESLYPRDMNDQ